MAQTNTVQVNAVEEYVSGLMKAAKLDVLPEDFQSSYTARLTDQVYRRIGLLALRELNETDLEEFNQLLKIDQAGATAADPVAVEQFLRSHVPDFAAKLKQGLEDLTTEFLAAFKKT